MAGTVVLQHAGDGVRRYNADLQTSPGFLRYKEHKRQGSIHAALGPPVRAFLALW